ncbi:hypothetical protein ABIA69_001694 [Lysinibacillus parviboronicapiens]|uniref:Uncharacterized protein n=1 Tax=Lysinibacillus parviboronicapiens TaxID=436516 RepID=A0ABV2PHW9_9BACI
MEVFRMNTYKILKRFIEFVYAWIHIALYKNGGYSFIMPVNKVGEF